MFLSTNIIRCQNLFLKLLWSNRELSLYQCSKCGCIENTALSRYWIDDAEDGRKLCSECDPKIGKWHNMFKKVYLPKGVFVTDRYGNLIHKNTGEDTTNYISDSEYPEE